MARSLIWLVLCFGSLFGFCPGAEAAEPSDGSTIASLPAANRYEVTPHKVKPFYFSPKCQSGFACSAAKPFVGTSKTNSLLKPSDNDKIGSLPAADGNELIPHKVKTFDPYPYSACKPGYVCLTGKPSDVDKIDSPSEANGYEAYAEKVIAADRQYKAVSISIYNYVDNPQFERLVQASVRNPDFCVRFLSEEKYLDDPKGTAILAMYRLAVDQYITFVRNLMKLRDRNLISSEQLLSGLYPRLVRRGTIYELYQHSGIRSLLVDMKARDDIGPSDKEQIERILSGEALAESREFDRECCSAPHAPLGTAE